MRTEEQDSEETVVMFDDACDVICEALSVTSTLRVLDMSVNPTCGKVSQQILDSFKMNDTIEKLFLPK